MTIATNSHPFLLGGGEMGERTQQFDWAQTAVGPLAQWPPSLRTLVQMMLTSRFPMLIFWGPELVTFYNDAFRPSLGNNGKHPGSLGQRGELSWAESWPVIGPMIHTIMAGGEAVFFEDQKLPIYREGQMGYAYWTYSFSPLADDAGAVGGVLVTCSETTKAVESVNQLQQTNAQLQHTQQALQNAVDLAQLGIWKIDVATQRATFSDQVAHWVGRPEPITLQEVIAAIDPADISAFESALQKAYSVESGGQFDVEYHLRNTQTEAVYLLHSMGQMEFDADNRPVSLYGFSRDVTQIRANQLTLEHQVRERTQELLQANQDLHRSNDNLQQFAYVASHDLQEPLRKIQSFSSLLNDQYGSILDEEGRDLLSRLELAGARMSTLIKDLLTYSRIATRQQSFGLIALDEVLTQALDTLSLVTQQRQAQIVSDPLPIIQGDESQLQRLFQNLVSNAIKFTPADQIPQIYIHYKQLQPSELPADVRPIRQASSYHLLSVADKGIGFDKKYLDRIFGVFQRLHNRNEYPGSGVGLAICQRVTENHGGYITATSDPGKGATFCIYLPG